MHIRTLQRKGYTVKSSTVGHWVDGRCGFLVAGYYASRDEAVAEAGRRIRQAQQEGRQPVWLIH